MFDQIRLVWNLTARCPMHCAHCAASAKNDTPDDADTKQQILQAVVKSGLPAEFDFSGGDPWSGAGGIEAMQEASKIYGRQNVAISGLGASALHQNPDFLHNLAGAYSFTYDKPFWYEDDRIGYNSNNFLALCALRVAGGGGVALDATLPIWDMDERYQEELAHSITMANPDGVKLLRLMPVGRNSQLIANDNEIADAFIERLRAWGFPGTVKKNCAMTGQCNGLSDHKLGLDYYGDLYWCIWAADLPVKKQRNPFYLGNLLEEPLLDILARHREKAATIPRDRCHVLEYLQSTKGSPP